MCSDGRLWGSVFFPMIGLGLFALQVDLGISPALFSLAMLLTYSVILGMVYGALNFLTCLNMRSGMSVLGQKATSAGARATSALAPRTDIERPQRHVRKVPIAEVRPP